MAAIEAVGSGDLSDRAVISFCRSARHVTPRLILECSGGEVRRRDVSSELCFSMVAETKRSLKRTTLESAFFTCFFLKCKSKLAL